MQNSGTNGYAVQVEEEKWVNNKNNGVLKPSKAAAGRV